MNIKIFWILFCTFISNLAYSVIAPFLPIEFVDKGVSLTVIGIIFAIYSVAVIIWSPIVGDKILLKCEVAPKVVITAGMILMGICFFAFGMLEFIESNTWLIVAGTIIRFF
jgi:MFS family permease